MEMHKLDNMAHLLNFVASDHHAFSPERKWRDVRPQPRTLPFDLSV